MGKGVIAACIGALGVLLLFYVLRRDADLKDSLPPKFQLRNLSDAQFAAWAYAAREGEFVRAVLGTGSMSRDGYIPAAPEGSDPGSTIVAYVSFSEVPFDELMRGDLVIFTADTLLLHQIVERGTSDSWLTAGNNNDRFDGWGREVRRDNYLGRVSAVFTVK